MLVQGAPGAEPEGLADLIQGGGIGERAGMLAEEGVNGLLAAGELRHPCLPEM
jgi:hypothetical protein